MSGYIRISRDLWSDEAFANAPFSEREAWVWLIAEASWKDRKKRVGDAVVSLKRSQAAHSTRFMADTWGWTHSKARRFLDRLEKLDLIRRETDTGVSVITICKYDKYQADAQTADTGPAQDRHTSGTNEKKDEIKGKKEKGESAQVRAARLPRDWVLPRDWGQWALDEGWSERTIRQEAEKFKDFWIGKAGKDAVKADWQATWRNWIRKEPKDANNDKGFGNSRRRSDPHSALFAGFGAAADSDDGGGAEPSGEMRDVTPSGETGMAHGPSSNDAGPFLRVAAFRS